MSAVSASKSSKSSSFQSNVSIESEDSSVLADVGHFEDIGLDDDSATLKARAWGSQKPLPNPPSRSSSRSPLPSPNPNGRTLASSRHAPKPRRSFPNFKTESYNGNPRSTSLTVLADPRPITLTRGNSTNSMINLPLQHHQRSRSPGFALSPTEIPSRPNNPRRRSWQANHPRRSLADLEHECDEDDGDDIPDGFILDNVPISPRAVNERPPSRGPSPAPERAQKERVRSVGNGTPATAQASGSLRSPTWKTDAALAEGSPHSPLKARAQSWNAALAELNADTKSLTEKLEEHADELDEEYARRPSVNRPNTWNSSRRSVDHLYDKKNRIKSTPELPPLRRTNIMIDPLPVSKEKEAVLSRTRPSWLPPKDPAEERKHLREYQKMMVASAKADEKREAARKSVQESKDRAADDLMYIWEHDIGPRWGDAVRERRTKELWWRGVPPRSRGFVWPRAIGNILGLSETSFEAVLTRVRDTEDRVKSERGDGEDTKRAGWFAQIRRDVAEGTLHDLRIFQVGGPLHDGLVDVLSAYAMYRNDVGYVSGCNTIAALLLLNLPNRASTFIALANIMNRPLPLSFFTCDDGAQASAYNLVLQMLSHKSPRLAEHLTRNIQELSPEMYLGEMLASIFTGHLPIDEAARLWDVYVFEGDSVLVRAAVALLLRREMSLLGSRTAEEVARVMAGTSRALGKSSTSSSAPPTRADEEKFMKTVREVRG